MDSVNSPVPLNAIRAFVAIARERSVTRAAASLDITQSSASHHLAVLEDWTGAPLVERRGRSIELTEHGRLLYEALADTFDELCFTARRMRRSDGGTRSLVIRTSLPTFAYGTLIPHLAEFSDMHDGAVVELVTSLAPPSAQDRYDVLITRDLRPPDSSDEWELLEEWLICVGAPSLAATVDLTSRPLPTRMITVTSRPDILPRWCSELGLKLSELGTAAKYAHHYLALPAATTSQGLLVVPEVLVTDLLQDNLLAAVPGSRVRSGMRYRAFAMDRAGHSDLARAFCQWLVRLCRKKVPAA